MARWQPPAEVGINEHIGRRLFDEPLLAGARQQPSYRGLLLTHFEETRSDEYSLDRLGQSCADRKVVRYLEPIALKHGAIFRKPKRFDGWAVLRAGQLANTPDGSKFPVIPSPNAGAENIYHAHVVKPVNLDHHSMALHLRHLFTTYGRVEPIAAAKSFWPRWIPSWLRDKLTTFVG